MDAMEEPKRGLGEAIAALGRLRATGDTKHVFEITRALGSNKPPVGYARLLTTPQGAPTLLQRPALLQGAAGPVRLAPDPQAEVEHAASTHES